MNNYIGITIGPIYRMITRQRSTRSLFSASYLISYITKYLVEKMGDQVISPKYRPELEPKPEVGYYHDRIFVHNIKMDAVNQHIAKLFENIVEEILDETASENDKLNYLKSYLRIYAIEIKAENKIKAIQKLNPELDRLELLERAPDVVENDYLQELFSNRRTGNFSLEDAFNEGGNHKYLSQIEIALGEYKVKFPDTFKECSDEHLNMKAGQENVSEFIKNLKTEGEQTQSVQFRHAHLHTAFVLMDGDHFGKYINGDETLKEEGYDQFSDKLFKFSKCAKNKIRDFGGQAIYIGGDDLLFVAPVLSSIDDKPTNILEFIQDIEMTFKAEFRDEGLTLSCGIAIGHYKYPMNEVLKKAIDLLYKAKTYQSDNSSKNAIALSVLRHSEKEFGFMLPFTSVFLTKLHELKAIEADKEQSLMRSFIYKLPDILIVLFEVFDRAAHTDLENTPDEEEVSAIDKIDTNALKFKAIIKNTIQNNFDEAIHFENSIFLDLIIDLVSISFQQSIGDLKYETHHSEEKRTEISKQRSKVQENITSLLKWIHFINLKNREYEPA